MKKEPPEHRIKLVDHTGVNCLGSNAKYNMHSVLKVDLEIILCFLVSRDLTKKISA